MDSSEILKEAINKYNSIFSEAKASNCSDDEANIQASKAMAKFIMDRQKVTHVSEKKREEFLLNENNRFMYIKGSYDYANGRPPLIQECLLDILNYLDDFLKGYHKVTWGGINNAQHKFSDEVKHAILDLHDSYDGEELDEYCKQYMFYFSYDTILEMIAFLLDERSVDDE